MATVRSKDKNTYVDVKANKLFIKIFEQKNDFGYLEFYHFFDIRALWESSVHTRWVLRIQFS